jgi:hypothetical protein
MQTSLLLNLVYSEIKGFNCPSYEIPWLVRSASLSRETVRTRLGLSKCPPSPPVSFLERSLVCCLLTGDYVQARRSAIASTPSVDTPFRWTRSRNGRCRRAGR